MWRAGIIIIGLLSAFAAVIWGCVALLNYGGDARETKIRLEISEARNESLEKAQKEVIDGIKNLQTIEDQIRNSPPGDNRRAGPILRDQLGRMRSPEN